MLERLKTLSELRGVSGRENAVRRFIREEAGKMGLKAETDAMGNVTVLPKKAKETGSPKAPTWTKRAFLAGRRIGSDGLISCRNNDIDPPGLWFPGGCRSGRKDCRLIGARPYTSSPKRTNQETVTGHENLYVDIGGEGQSERGSKVRA